MTQAAGDEVALFNAQRFPATRRAPKDRGEEAMQAAQEAARREQQARIERDNLEHRARMAARSQPAAPPDHLAEPVSIHSHVLNDAEGRQLERFVRAVARDEMTRMGLPLYPRLTSASEHLMVFEP